MGQSNDLKFGRKPEEEDADNGVVKEKKLESDMVPKPYDDLFIEPAGDYDIVYADYNATWVFLSVYSFEKCIFLKHLTYWVFKKTILTVSFFPEGKRTKKFAELLPQFWSRGK